MTAPRVNVITSCTGRKTPLADGGTIEAERLYRGQQHLRLMRGVDRLRDSGGDADVWIVSAGHGLVAGKTELPWYERTFQGTSPADRRALADHLDIPGAVRDVLARPADLAIVLLGDAYLDVCRLDADMVAGAPTVVFASATTALQLPAMPGIRVVPLRVEHTRAFGAGYVALKGEVGGRALHALAAGQSVDELLADDPLAVLAAVSTQPEAQAATATLF